MQKRVTFLTSSDKTHQFGYGWGDKFKNGGTLFLFGDLGSGKTTFSQGFAKGIGITRLVNSPTFLIMRSYVLPEKESGKFYHIDLYRIQSEKEVIDLGILELFNNPDNCVVVEWSEHMGSLLPEKRVEIHFSYVDEITRKVEEVLYD